MKYNFDKNYAFTDALANLGKDFRAVKSAEMLYKSSAETCMHMLKEVLEDATFDKPILNRDLANAAGISPAHMATIIRSCFKDNISCITVTVTTYFREVDETGHIIEGGSVQAKHHKVRGYVGNNWY